MAKYNINHSKMDKLKEKAGQVLQLKQKPIVIPKDKLEAAHAKVLHFKKREQKVIKISGTIILTLIGVIAWMLMR